MLAQSIVALSMTAFAAVNAVPVAESHARRAIDLTRRDIADVQVGSTIGSQSGAYVGATVADSGDIDAEVAAKLGHLLGLDLKTDVGLGKLLHGLLPSLFNKRDIINTDIGATVGSKTSANVGAVVKDNLDTSVDVDAKVGRLLGLDVNANLGLGKLLKNILSLGGLIHKRDDVTLDLDARIASLLATDVGVRANLADILYQLTHLDVSINAKRDLVNTDINADVAGIKTGVDATIKNNLDTSANVDLDAGRLAQAKANLNLGLGRLLKSVFGLLGVHSKRDLVSLDVDATLANLLNADAEAKVQVQNFITALLSANVNVKRSLVDGTVLASADENGINSGTVVSAAGATAGVGELINKDGVAAGAKLDSDLADADVEALLNKNGLATGATVSSGDVNAGLGLIASSSGDVSTGVVANVGNLVSADGSIDLGLAKLLHGLLGGIISAHN
ncbi:hypothetical protein JCM10212_004207 [Sporobolomyces blumeae]